MVAIIALSSRKTGQSLLERYPVERLDWRYLCYPAKEDWISAICAIQQKTELSHCQRGPARSLDCRCLRNPATSLDCRCLRNPAEDWIVALVARSSKKTVLSLPVQTSNKCFTNNHSMLNHQPCRQGLLLSTRHVTRPTAELLRGFDNCLKQRKTTFHVNMTRRLDRCLQKTSIFRFQYRVSLRNSPQCTAARRQRSEQPRHSSKTD